MASLVVKLGLIACTVIALSVNACNLDRDPTKSLVVADKSLNLCDELVNTVDELVDRFVAATRVRDAEQAGTSDYWSDWILKNVDDPLLTQRIEDGFLGFGVFRPYEMTLNDDELSYEEWIKTHGIQLSLGIGDKNGDEPRVRLDYQWHDRHEDLVHVQVEVPF